MRISADGETSCPSRVGPSTLYAKSGSNSYVFATQSLGARHETCVAGYVWD